MARHVDPGMLTLEPLYFSKKTLYFLRFSVILVDALYLISCAILSNVLVEHWYTGRKGFEKRLKLAIFAVLSSNSGLFLLDNIHFQYNSFLYGIFFLSLSAIISQKLLLGAFLFATLLNFKHLYIYYVPAFVAFYIKAYLLPFDKKFFIRIFELASTLFIVLALSFGPFYIKGGMPAILQIIERLFPFKRGLTHAYWAPNVWSLYNLVDLILYKSIESFKMAGTLSPPEYTKGLVREYTHSVIPNITPFLTLALIIISIIPSIIPLYKSHKKMRSNNECEVKLQQAFFLSIILSAYAFYLFGWHVHEKAILMALLPMCAFGFVVPRYICPMILLSIAGQISLLPLLFTPVECLLKYGLILAHFSVTIFSLYKVFGLEFDQLITCSSTKFIALLAIFGLFYNFLHTTFLPNFAEFLPLMVISNTCAVCIVISYIQILMLTFFPIFEEIWLKQLCLWRERRIDSIERVSRKFPLDNVKYIAGMDIQVSSTEDTLGVVALNILSYPELSVEYSVETTICLPSVSYIPEFLAIREAEVLARFFRKHRSLCPPPDLLFIDGNGKWHSRGCGLACHVGYLVGIPTIGMAKNFTGFPILFNNPQLPAHNIEELIKARCRKTDRPMLLHLVEDQIDDEPLDIDKLLEESSSSIDDTRLSIIRPANTSAPFYVSAGFCLNHKVAAEFTFDFLSKNSLCNPIRLSDVRARRRIFGLMEQ